MTPDPQPQLSREGSSVFNQTRRIRRVNGWLSKIAPGLAATLALKLFGTPRRHRTPHREQQWVANTQPFELRVGGHTLNAWQIGSGPTILLSHGWEGRASQLGAFIDPLVAAGFHVVGVDAYAHGRSDGRYATLLDFADVASEIAWRFKPLYGVIAHSFGTAATTLAISQGTSVQRAVYLGAPSRLTPYTLLFARMLGFSEQVRRRMIQKLEQRFGLVWEEVQPANLAANMQAPPLLAIWDSDDTDVSEEMARGLFEAWSGDKRWCQVHGHGHQRMLRNTEVIERAVAFLRENPAGSGETESDDQLTLSS